MLGENRKYFLDILAYFVDKDKDKEIGYKLSIYFFPCQCAVVISLSQFAKSWL